MNAFQRAVQRPWIILPMLALLYSAMFQKYRPYDIDNAWFLSFSYNLCDEHVETDTFWQVRFPAGMDGTHLFGKLAAYTQCGLLNQVGWLPRAASMLTIGAVVASLALWWLALLQMGYSPLFVGYFILLFGVSNVALGMAEVFRYEFFSFFLLSLALWLSAVRLPFLALLVALLGLETQPSALAGVLAIIVLLHAQGGSKARLALRALCATMAAAAIYLLLHPHALHQIAAGSGTQAAFVPGSTLMAYYVKDPKHLIELGVLITGCVLFWKNRTQIKDQQIGLASLVLLLFMLLFPHSNTYYLIFAFPFWLFTALLGYRYAPKLAWLPGALAVLTLLSYGPRFKANLHQGYTANDIAQVASFIRQGEAKSRLDDRNLLLVGDRTLWYAHPNHYLSASAATPLVGHGDLYLCYSNLIDPLRMIPVEEATCDQLSARAQLVFLSRMELKGQQLNLYRKLGR